MMVSSLLLRPFPSASFKEEPFTRGAGFTSKILLKRFNLEKLNSLNTRFKVS